MSEINIRIGGDNSDYKRVLEDSAVSSATFNAKIAAQAAAQSDAENRLAILRGKNDTLRAAGFNKDIFLQREILGLKAEIATMEEGSITQIERKIVLEGKLLQLEQIIAAEKVAVSGVVEKEAAAIETAATKTNSLKDAFNAMGLSLKGAGIGIVFGAFLTLTKAAIADAQKLRDELKEAGKPIDGATKSLARFGDSLSAVKKLAVDSVGFLIGGFTQLGEVVGSAINRLRGISESQENIMEGIADQTEASLARIAEAKKKFDEDNTPEKRAERAKEALAKEEEEHKAFFERVGKMRADAAEQERGRRQSLYDFQKTLDDQHAQFVDENMEQLRLEAKAVQGLTVDEAKRLEVLKLIAKQKIIEEQITTLLALKKRTPDEERLLQTLIAESGVISGQIKLITDVKNAIAGITPVIASNIKEWENFALAIKTTGRADPQLSDRELERKIQNITADLNARAATSLGSWQGPLAFSTNYDPLADIQNSSRSRAQAELDFRRQVRQTAATQGERAAFDQFNVSDQRLREILQIAPGLADVSQELKGLRQQFAKGVPTVLFGDTSAN